MTSNEIEVRQREFAEEFEGFEPEDVVKLVFLTGEWLERLLLDPAAIDGAMKALYQGAIAPDPEIDIEAVSWRDLWSQLLSSGEFELRTSQYFVGLHAFAFYGLRPDIEFFGLTPEPLVDGVKSYVATGRSLLDETPPRWGSLRNLEQTVLAAEARLNLDTEQGVSPEQLAALAKVSLKSIKNMLSPGSGSELELDDAGLIPSDDAARWVASREDFKTSVWRSSGPPSVAEEADLGEVVFVPVTKDGTWFDPVSCYRPSGYQIGAKGSEIYLEEYWSALEALKSMAVPRWRRPNHAGNFGIVVGTSWRRMSIAELQAMIGS